MRCAVGVFFVSHQGLEGILLWSLPIPPLPLRKQAKKKSVSRHLSWEDHQFVSSNWRFFQGVAISVDFEIFRFFFNYKTSRTNDIKLDTTTWKTSRW